jgi:dephospho-CoA kinase
MLKIGLTGGIGCGKSTVARLFSELDTPVIDADEIAHHLVEKGQPALKRIAQEFGQTILNEDGTLNRSTLKDLVFSDSRHKQTLEAILHPLIYQTIQSEIENISASYCIICIPLLIETDKIRSVDRVLVVDCPVETQIKRVETRDRLSIEQIKAILENQVSRAVRISQADDIIDNSEIETGLAEQVKKLHNLYLSLSTAGLTRP